MRWRDGNSRSKAALQNLDSIPAHKPEIGLSMKSRCMFHGRSLRVTHRERGFFAHDDRCYDHFLRVVTLRLSRSRR